MTGSEVVQIIVAVGGVLVLLMNTWATLQTKQQVGVLQEKTDATAQDQNAALETIHANGNAHLSLMTEKLAESERRNELLINESNERVERASKASIDRIEKLESLLVAKVEAGPPAPEPVGHVEPIRVQIEQPPEQPVPVTLPKQER